jgi:hypothetical protein
MYFFVCLTCGASGTQGTSIFSDGIQGIGPKLNLDPSCNNLWFTFFKNIFHYCVSYIFEKMHCISSKVVHECGLVHKICSYIFIYR